VGRGLGKLQKSALMALEAYPKSQETDVLSGLARPTDLLIDLGLTPTPVTRAAMSRALSTLVQRGLIEAWEAETSLPGGGRRYVLPGRARRGSG
jgi:hypothetical protein